MSIVNLLANDIWSDADITNRTEAMVSSRYPFTERDILQRKATAALFGVYVLTPDEEAAIADFQSVAEAARQAGVQARADMSLLLQAMAMETAQARLALEPVPDDQQDAADRAAAQAVVDAATDQVAQLVAQRAAARAPAEPATVEEGAS